MDILVSVVMLIFLGIVVFMVIHISALLDNVDERLSRLAQQLDELIEKFKQTRC